MLKPGLVTSSSWENLFSMMIGQGGCRQITHRCSTFNLRLKYLMAIKLTASTLHLWITNDFSGTEHERLHKRKRLKDDHLILPDHFKKTKDDKKGELENQKPEVSSMEQVRFQSRRLPA